MASYGSYGTFISVQEICTDPCGPAFLGLVLNGSQFDHHVHLRGFSAELQAAGLARLLAKTLPLCERLGSIRGFATGYVVETRPVPHVAWDYLPGRSLAHILAKAKHDRMPIGVDPSLYLISELAHSLRRLHESGSRHGLLSPHSIWLGYEGTLHLVDAPYASCVHELLPACPALRASLAAYQAPSPRSPLQEDLYALGALLFELFTLAPLSHRDQIDAIRAGRLHASLEPDKPIPAPFQPLLERLVVGTPPFENMADFCREFEAIVFSQEQAPTTFNTAFLMHSLFRQERKFDEQAREKDRQADFAPLVQLQAAPSRALHKRYRSTRFRWGLMAGLTASVLLALMIYTFHTKSLEAEASKVQLSELQRLLTQKQAQLADINAREKESQQREVQLQHEQAGAKTQDEKVRIQNALENERHKALELSQERAALVQHQEQLQNQTQALASKPVDSPPPAAPVPPPPAVALAPAPDTVINQSVSTQVPSKSSEGGVVDVVGTPVQILVQKSPTASRLANTPILQRLKNANRDLHVVIRVDVDALGKPVKAEICGGEQRLTELVEASLKAAMASSYQPATVNGQPIPGWTIVDYNFGKPWRP